MTSETRKVYLYLRGQPFAVWQIARRDNNRTTTRYYMFYTPNRKLRRK